MKALIAVLVVLVLAVVGLGGFFVYRFVVDEQSASQAQEEDPEEESVAGSGKGPLERMRPPKTEADVIGNLASAIEKNHDAVGWLEVPGTDINHVVMQGDDNRYYERRNADGFEDIYGCYFLDYECRLGTRDILSHNTVIYGHSDLKDSPDGPRFSQLFRFVDPTFAASNPYLFVTTMEERFTFEIFSVFYTDTSFDYIQVNIDDAATLALAQEAKALSVHPYDVEPVAGDRLLTLSTCSVKYGTDGTQRFVVMGRLCPVGFEPTKGQAAVPGILTSQEKAEETKKMEKAEETDKDGQSKSPSAKQGKDAEESVRVAEEG